LHFLDIIEDVDALEQDLETVLGSAPPSYQKLFKLEGKWWWYSLTFNPDMEGGWGVRDYVIEPRTGRRGQHRPAGPVCKRSPALSGASQVWRVHR
jgi:hypothetical protein